MTVSDRSRRISIPDPELEELEAEEVFQIASLTGTPDSAMRCSYSWSMKVSLVGCRLYFDIYLELYQNLPVDLLKFLVSFLNMTFSLFLPLKYPDVIHRSFQNGSLVLPDIPHYVIILLILLGQQRSQLLYPVIDVESSATLNYSNIRVSTFLHFTQNIFNLLIL